MLDNAATFNQTPDNENDSDFFHVSLYVVLLLDGCVTNK
jgi:hypothetical protein